jgi:hypothetical protein
MTDTSRLWARPWCHLSGSPHSTRQGQLPCAYSRKVSAGAFVRLGQHGRDNGPRRRLSRARPERTNAKIYAPLLALLMRIAYSSA